MTRVLIIPAAGAGSRLQSTLPKPLAPVGGRAMIDHLLDRYAAYAERFVVVVNPAHEDLMRRHLESLSAPAAIEVQHTATGMLDAILVPMAQVRAWGPASVWVTWCDQVGILPETIARLARVAAPATDTALAFPTARREAPYIHLERDPAGRITRVLQRREGDPMPQVGESDAGLFALSPAAYLEWLPAFAAEVAEGTSTSERNFLPFIPWLAERALIQTVPCTDVRESVGINTPDERLLIEQFLAEGAHDRRSRRDPAATLS